MRNTSTTEKIIASIILGVSIGGALGILFAPDKGIKTRNKISKKGNELNDALKMKIKDLKKEVKAEAKTVKQKAIQLKEKGIAALEQTNSIDSIQTSDFKK